MRDGLWAVLVVCIVIRLCAWLVEPALPTVLTLLFLVSIFALVLQR